MFDKQVINLLKKHNLTSRILLSPRDSDLTLIYPNQDKSNNTNNTNIVISFLKFNHENQCVIGTISHIAQAHVNAPHQFKAHGEPCSLFLLTEGQSGSRKSTSKNLADKAITEYERKAYDQYKDDVQQWKTLQAGLPKADREIVEVRADVLQLL